MLRQSLISGVMFLSLAACGQEAQFVTTQQQAPSPAPPPPPPAFAPAVEIPQSVLITGSLMGPAGPKLAYTHNLAVEMADDMVAPRFERGRNVCLQDQSLNCNLIEASITVGNSNAGVRPRATLSVRLPHDSVSRFESLLLDPLPGEAAGEPSLRRSSTNAEDLTMEIAEVDRRLAQAIDYRGRLTVLSRRADAKVDDLIKVQQNLSEVQSSIEAMSAETRQLNRRVDTELLNISLGAYDRVVNVSSPLGQAWRDSARALGQSTASAFLFVVVLLPWLPLVALAGLAAALLLRWVRNARRRKGSVAAT
jgi:uncharacterized protein DUF4349